MVENSFLHLPGIGELTEQNLWNQGVTTWDDLRATVSDHFGAKRASRCLVAIEESQAALEAGEYQFFQERLGNAHSWRLIPKCDDSIAYLDIETTGTAFPPMGRSTTIAVAFRGELFVEHDRRKKQTLFEKLHDEVKMWVTFNGLSFDLPFLRRETLLPFRQPHVDLRVWLRRLGYRGGLKVIQKQFVEIPDRAAMDIDGFDAVRLWAMHQRGIAGALETLMTYNAEDTVVLETLLHLCWKMQKEKFSFMNLPDRKPTMPPKITTQVHPHIYRMLKG